MGDHVRNGMRGGPTHSGKRQSCIIMIDIIPSIKQNQHNTMTFKHKINTLLLLLPLCTGGGDRIITQQRRSHTSNLSIHQTKSFGSSTSSQEGGDSIYLMMMTRTGRVYKDMENQKKRGRRERMSAGGFECTTKSHAVIDHNKEGSSKQDG